MTGKGGMEMTVDRDALMALLTKAEDAHQLAYQDTEGVDEEWPMWYADFLIEDLRHILNVDLTRSELICVLLNLSRLQPLEAPGEDWQVYYADYLLERYAS
jgi:hypothetical protein